MTWFYGAHAIIWVGLIVSQLTQDYPRARFTQKVNEVVTRVLWTLYGDPNVD